MIKGGLYPTEVFWSDDDEGFIAVAPDLPGCSAFGESRSEAAAELDDAIAAWIEAAVAAGNPIPEPSSNSAIENYSGKVLVRMTKELHRDLSREAASQNVSLNQYICFRLGKSHYSNSTTTSVVFVADHAARKSIQSTDAAYTGQSALALQKHNTSQTPQTPWSMIPYDNTESTVA